MARQATERREIDRKQVTDYLDRAFNAATEHLGRRNHAGTQLHELQVDMAYLINEIEMGPEASAKHAITQANKLINSIPLNTA